MLEALWLAGQRNKGREAAGFPASTECSKDYWRPEQITPTHASKAIFWGITTALSTLEALYPEGQDLISSGKRTNSEKFQVTLNL